MKNIIFGIRAVAEAIEAEQNIERVYVKRGAEGQLIQELKEMIRERGLNMQEVPEARLDRFVRGNHQGVVAQIAAIEYAELEDVLQGIGGDETPLFVVLDGVTDVRNFGAIARSAECAGAHALIVPLKSAAPVNADAIKTSAGALTRIAVCRVGSIKTTILMLRNRGVRSVAMGEKGGKLLFDADMKTPLAIVMGSEDVGISRAVLKVCDEELRIPLAGEIESLNVSAAAAVVLFEAVRQRMK